VSERIIETDDAVLATEAFGDPAKPPILLIMGQMASMLWWPDAFCQRLAARGRYVIRYDNRDTGRSTSYDVGAPPYTVDDMVDDTVRVLDGYGLAMAHVVGMSMGSMIAQLAALKYSTRVATLTVISSSPFTEDTPGLPGPSPAYMEHGARFADVDWTDRDQVIAFMVEDSRQLAGSGRPFDEAGTRRFIEHDYDRATRFASATNHTRLEGGDSWHGRLGEVQAPLLVIHGTADPIFPIEHGEALARAVPGASLVRLDGGGHELHEADWDTIITAIVSHTSDAAKRVQPAANTASE
jgi:pimeloyl-ACP methyl ester carboxylesterase